MTSSQPPPFLLADLDGERVDHLLSQFFSSIRLPPLVARPYSLKLYSSSAFYVYSSLSDDLPLVEVLRTELVGGDYDFYTSCGCCRRYSVLWNSLCVDTSTGSAVTVTVRFFVLFSV